MPNVRRPRPRALRLAGAALQTRLHQNSGECDGPAWHEDPMGVMVPRTPAVLRNEWPTAVATSTAYVAWRRTALPPLGYDSAACRNRSRRSDMKSRDFR